ncbi:MAG: Acetyl esterase/lipase [Frankiales bacterium]|nr:Acetyl esterase/lipase [Frankiales bacterium]
MNVVTHPPFDPELNAALLAMADAGQRPKPLTAELIVPNREAGTGLSPSDDQLRRGGKISFEERSAPGPAGAPDLPLLICRPTDPTAASDAGIYYVHGGGMVGGDNRTAIDVVLDWVEAFGVTVISVGYRLAPEHPYPAPVQDCYAGLEWVAGNAAELGVNAERIIISGGSAGGGLAAAVALMARDRNGPTLLGQVLICPMLDDRNETPSSHELDDEGVWDRTSNVTGWTAFLGDQHGALDVSPYAAPARSTSLAGLPPTFIDVGSVETFRDEDIDYAVRIWREGGDCELHVWPGGFHGFDMFLPEAELSRKARAVRQDWVRRLLER